MKKIILFLIISYSIFSQGKIEFPGFGIFSFEEGTFEAWVKLEFDLKDEIKKFKGKKGILYSKGGIFLAEIPEQQSTFSITFGFKDEGRFEKTDIRFYCRIGFVIEGKKIPHPIYIDLSNWEKDSWHHLAISWFEGKKVKVYIDGRPIEISSLLDKTVYLCGSPFITDISTDAKITLGTAKIWYLSENPISIDEVRISSIARDKEELGYYKFPLIPDQYTLFLENFENIEGEFTKPYISNIKLENKYKIEKGKLIEGKIGKGYCFSSKQGE